MESAVNQASHGANWGLERHDQLPGAFQAPCRNAWRISCPLLLGPTDRCSPAACILRSWLSRLWLSCGNARSWSMGWGPSHAEPISCESTCDTATACPPLALQQKEEAERNEVLLWACARGLLYDVCDGGKGVQQ